MANNIRRFTISALRQFYDNLNSELSNIYESKSDAEDNEYVVTYTLNNQNERLNALESTTVWEPGNGANSAIISNSGNFAGDYSVAEGLRTVASGTASHAENSYTYAFGWNSHAEGIYTYTYGFASHVEGEQNTVNSTCGHAEGMYTIAGQNQDPFFGGHDYGSWTTYNLTYNYTHAEGFVTLSYGSVSHAEGDRTLAGGEAAHSEGTESYAFGHSSHAENWWNRAFGYASHAEGMATWSLGNCSHSAGCTTIAYGKSSHAEGYSDYYPYSGLTDGGTTMMLMSGTGTELNSYTMDELMLAIENAGGGILAAMGDWSHAEGFGTLTVGKGAHSEGDKTVAFGYYSHAEGASQMEATFLYNTHYDTIISSWYENSKEFALSYGVGSHVEGGACLAVGYLSHAEGISTITIGTGAHSEGLSTNATGDTSHAEGAWTSAFGSNSHAEGKYTNTGEGSDSSHAEGIYTLSLGDFSHAEGNGTRSKGNGSHAEGDNTAAYGNYSHSTGGSTSTYTNTINANTLTYFYNNIVEHPERCFNIAYGQYSTTEGFNTFAYGQDSHAEGFTTFAKGTYSHTEGLSTYAYGNAAHAEGRGTIAGGDYSHAEGNGTVAAGDYSHAEGGWYNYVSGICSHVEGDGNNVSGDYSHAEGINGGASGNYSHKEGNYNYTYNRGEHAEGNYNYSLKANNNYGNAGNTTHTIGIGTSDSTRRNAVAVMENGNTYIYNIGNYAGQAVTSATSLQGVISSLTTRITTLETNGGGSGSGSGTTSSGFTRGTATVAKSSSNSITFTGLSGEPKAFFVSLPGGYNTGTQVVSVIGDSTGVYAVYATSTAHNWASSGFTKSYSGTSFTITAPSGYNFNPSGTGSISLVYYYGSDTLTFNTIDYNPSNGVTANTFSDSTHLTALPNDWCLMLTVQTTTDSNRRISSIIGQEDTVASRTFYSNNQVNDSTSNITVNYNNGLYINTGGAGAGGYLHNGGTNSNPGTYRLYYLMAEDVGSQALEPITKITVNGVRASVSSGTAAITYTAPGTLNTNLSTAQSVNSSESLSGTINLHKVAKTGNYNDLLNKPATLPTVTSSNNGQILRVVNGAWAAVSPSTIYSGSGTPSNSTGNNGDLYLQTS